MPDFVASVVVSVRHGVIDAVTFADSGIAVDASNFPRYRTIEGLFDLIQDVIDGNAYQISVTYDAELGYPSRARIDYEKNLADEEMAFIAHSLVAVR